jgi:hypothetical protein
MSGNADNRQGTNRAYQRTQDLENALAGWIDEHRLKLPLPSDSQQHSDFSHHQRRESSKTDPLPRYRITSQ